ncbi:helix-turn-helix domain-containing protein [Streptacidiphilus fuscans]|uniref:Helix-turn-helix domain-containing protein n=1 Tax=Streptacidiphilus fuscans TaxID=2789292 RepID=A0A931B567_9ACTN|nr:XRE family transcriptional regulator [Streptacidiphilus fuscans]MBF9069607.1 helix-turn-helix domain-containing protein [Streptacidiphilus fuscans]
MSTTGPECRHLAAELRALRVRAGLSLAQLAAATTYSKSSWERYLNAKSLPPWAAVQELCRVADEPERALRALWELAEADWSGRGKVAANPAEAVTSSSLPESVTDNGGDDDVTAPPAKAVAVEEVEKAEVASEQAETPDEPATAAQPEPAAAPVRRPRRLHRLRSSTGLFAVVAVVCAMLTAGVAYAWRSDSPAPPAVPYWKAIRMGCAGASCVGQDAQQTGCGMGPTTVGPDYFTSSAGADLQFRYSTTCDTAWIKAWNAQVGDTVSLSTPGVATQDLLLANAFLASDGADTPMVTAGRGAVLRACLTPVGHPTQPQCFTERVP